MADVILNIETYWEEKSATCQPCEVCEDMIVSAAHELMMKVGEKIISSDIVLCNSCYDLIKDNGLSK